MRKSGYYWVKIYDAWIVMYYNGTFWAHNSEVIYDDDLQLICENRVDEPAIVRIDKKLKP
jgi:hypothetical protein